MNNKCFLCIMHIFSVLLYVQSLFWILCIRKRPNKKSDLELMEMEGFEPLTSALRTQRSPN